MCPSTSIRCPIHLVAFRHLIEQMSQITSIILPFFALIGLGWVGGKFRIVSPDGMRGINGFVFYFALPALLFKALATRSPSEIWQPDIILIYGGATLVVYGASRIIAAKVFHLDPSSQTLFSFAGTMGNVGFMGLPLIIGLLGPEATVPLIVALAVDLIIMLPLSLLLLEGAKHSKGSNPAGKIIRGTFTNPVVLAISFGVAASVLDRAWAECWPGGAVCHRRCTGRATNCREARRTCHHVHGQADHSSHRSVYRVLGCRFCQRA